MEFRELDFRVFSIEIVFEVMGMMSYFGESRMRWWSFRYRNIDKVVL